MGWEQCSHGLTSRPLETCHHQCLKAVCGFLGYPAGAAAELVDGYSSITAPHSFSGGFHTMSLFSLGTAGGLVKERVILLLISWMTVVMWLKWSG